VTNATLHNEDEIGARTSASATPSSCAAPGGVIPEVARVLTNAEADPDAAIRDAQPLPRMRLGGGAAP
jgi:NAD-dependent DNA ligase